MNIAIIKRNFSWSLAGNIIYAICQWLILIVIARLGSAKDVGVYSLGLAIAAPIMLFLGMNLRVVIATDQKCDFRFRDYFLLRMISSGLSLLIIGAIGIVLYGSDVYVLMSIVLIATIKSIESASEIYYGYFQQNERNDLISKSLMYRGVLSVVLIFPVYYYWHSLPKAMLVMLIVWLSVLLFYDIGRFRIFKIDGYESSKNNVTKVLGLAKTALPLGFVALFDSLVINISRYYTEYYYGLEKLGYFSSIVYLMVSGGVIVGALGYAVTPRMANLYLNGNNKEFVKVGLASVVIGISVGLLGIIVSMLFGGRLLGVIYGKDYVAYKDCFVIIMVASTLWYASGLAGCMLNAMRKFGHQLIANLISLVASSVALTAFGVTYGIDGVAWAMVIGMAVRLSITTVLVTVNIRAG